MGSKVIRNITKVFRSASGVLFGRATSGTGRGEELTPSQVRSLLSVSTTAETASLLAAKADLVGGLVPAGQLPSYVDDVIEAANQAAFPVTGESGKIYVALDTGKTYRWSGSAYVELTDSTAVWGSISGTLSNQTDLQSALNAKAAASHTHTQSDITNLVSDLAAKQATLVSGTNIKTVNGSTLLGSGDLTVSGGSSLAMNPGYRTNYYYSAFPCIAPSTLSLTNNRLHYIPFQVTESVTFTRIGINVSTAASGAGIRLGIYNSSSGAPSSLLLDAGTVSAATTGEKEITISQAMTPGWYWLAMVTDNAAVWVTAENGASSGDTVRVNLGVATGAGNGVVYVFHAFTYGSLPSSASSLSDMTGASNPPRIWLRKV